MPQEIMLLRGSQWVVSEGQLCPFLSSFVFYATTATATGLVAVRGHFFFFSFLLFLKKTIKKTPCVLWPGEFL